MTDKKKDRVGLNIGARLSWWLSVVFASMPFILPYLGWRYWYLRPFILYASILPYLFVPFVVLHSLPFMMCSMLGIIDNYRKILAGWGFRYLWAPYSRIMHGLENLPPKDKGAIVAYYHGVIPLDLVFMATAIWKRQRRVMGGAVHTGTLKIPILGSLLRAYGYSACGREEMIEELKSGALKSIAPGGDYEASYSQNYSVIFKNRIGFAVVAKAAGVPIIPMFTENIRECHRAHYFGFRSFFRYMSDEYGMPAIWAFGGLPVKLRTHIGEQMYCGDSETPEEFAGRVKKALEDLRDRHQKFDNSIIRALMDRFR